MNRLEGKVAIIVGAGQTPGQTIGNGRATAILFAREGAQLLLVDRRLDSAEQTLAMIKEEGGAAEVLQADVTEEDSVMRIPEACLRAFGRIDILQNNVGIGRGDGAIPNMQRETWDAILGANLTGTYLTCKHVLPLMREQGSGVITNISSLASTAATPLAAYKVSKAGVNALTQQLAMANARYGIRECRAPGTDGYPDGRSRYSRCQRRRYRGGSCPPQRHGPASGPDGYRVGYGLRLPLPRQRRSEVHHRRPPPRRRRPGREGGVAFANVR